MVLLYFNPLVTVISVDCVQFIYILEIFNAGLERSSEGTLALSGLSLLKT